MKKILYIILLICITVPSVADNRKDGKVMAHNIDVIKHGDKCTVSMQLVFDSLRLTSNHQFMVTPYFETRDTSKHQQVQLPTIVISGRNMHYVWLRSGKAVNAKHPEYKISREIAFEKGMAPIDYREVTDMQEWMLGNDAVVRVVVDTCGCGRPDGSKGLVAEQPVMLNPAGKMLAMDFPRPNPEGGKVIVSHNGRARVQFEVNHIELHERVYTCKSGQVIDNRAELQRINDSIKYALSDPNVEIESIVICGYASPESPYEHNNYLASNRSRALSEYIERTHHIPHNRCTYTCVTENWGEFREQVVAATDITEQQRKDLLELIDRPAYSPAEFDQKEKELKTLPKFAKLYKEKILPKWFPHLRATSFTINTQLKPMTDIQLREVLKKTPKLMSLDEVYRVAGTYEHGSKEWQEVMAQALDLFPDDTIANTNAAALAMEKKDLKAAETYLKKAGDNDTANILRGVLATYSGKFEEARQYFLKAKEQPEAQFNLKLLDN